MAISDWPHEERPRERLCRYGAPALSDAELLAIFLRVGVAGRSAVDLARDLLAHFGSLPRLIAASPQELTRIKGMGLAKATQLCAIIELARRGLAGQMRERPAFESPTVVRDFLGMTLAHAQEERFIALWLDAQHRLIAEETLCQGTLTRASVYPREVVKKALAHNAAAVIFAHNHPSGATEPSLADRTLTHQLKEALALIEVRLLDHFIVAPGAAPFSFAERGWI
ncbi:MAG: DNA repair protein RadC [Rhodocyclaceae bacterium]|nr:DNA repair protein RadC [Rhodocyclaceae bacterium]